MINAALLAKFKRRCPKIATQGHLDRAMFLFPVEHHDEIATHIQPLLKPGMTARKVESLPELKPKDPENPTLHESTVARLNAMSEQLATQRAQIQEHEKTIASQAAALAELQKVSK